LTLTPYTLTDTIRRPLRLTPFPYTTLFRSVERRGRLIEQHQLRIHGERTCDRNALLLTTGQVRWVVIVPIRETHTIEQLHRASPDRKSTRLNSSHVKISYAVFCLKKKRMNR